MECFGKAITMMILFPQDDYQDQDHDERMDLDKRQHEQEDADEYVKRG